MLWTRIFINSADFSKYWPVVKSTRSGIVQFWVQAPLTSCVTYSKLLNPSELQFPPL